MRQRILSLLQSHPEGLSAEQIRAYLKPDKNIGDTLQGIDAAEPKLDILTRELIDGLGKAFGKLTLRGDPQLVQGEIESGEEGNSSQE